MGLRRTAALSIATLATLLSAPMSHAGTGAAPPLTVEMSQVKCKDVSQLAEISPLLAEHLGGPDDVAHVRITIRGTAETDGAPYRITVDGQTKGQGYVGANGVVITGVVLEEDTESHISVRSGNTVVLERTVTPHC